MSINRYSEHTWGRSTCFAGSPSLVGLYLMAPASKYQIKIYYREGISFKGLSDLLNNCSNTKKLEAEVSKSFNSLNSSANLLWYSNTLSTTSNIRLSISSSLLKISWKSSSLKHNRNQFSYIQKPKKGSLIHKNFELL